MTQFLETFVLENRRKKIKLLKNMHKGAYVYVMKMKFFTSAFQGFLSDFVN